MASISGGSVTPCRPAQRQCQTERLRQRLEAERRALARWLARLKRAFNAIVKHQQSIARLERQIRKQEEE